jgi:hypothetical protein
MRKFSIPLSASLKIAILGVFVLLNILNLPSGWADNGDYDRIAQWFSSGPAALAENFPPLGTPEWDLRFYRYWIPEWKLDFPLRSTMFISAILLWLPGIVLNYLLFSNSVLWLPLMSLGARLALLLLLWWVLRWIDRRSARPWVHHLALGLPLALMFGTADLAGFYNTFYQETGTLVFLPLLLVVIAWGQPGARGWRYYATYLAAVTLVTLSKTSCFYWAGLGLPFAISLRPALRRPLLALPLAAVLVAVPLIAGLTLTEYHYAGGPNRPYNALFTGVLQLSVDPQARLSELGFPAQALDCVGKDWYSQGGQACSEPFWEQISYTRVLRVLWAEPAILFKQAEQLANAMQNLTLELGRYASADHAPRQEGVLNLWSELQQRVFPRGLLGLGLASLAILAACAWTWKKEGLPAALARVALVCLLGMGIDAFVQILGDGPRDLIKHLVIANVLFDLSALAAINAALGCLLTKY